MQTVIFAQLEAHDCNAELYINGIAALRITPRQVPIANAAVEQYLISGPNRITLIVEPGPSPSRARTVHQEFTGQPMRATGRLIRFPEGVPGFVEYGELLAAAPFAGSQDAGLPRKFPVEVSAAVDLGPAHGRWAWQDAPPLKLDQALIAQVGVLFAQLESAIRSNDIERFWQLTELKLQDMLRAYPALTKELIRADLELLFAHVLTGKDPVLPRAPSRHDFRLLAGDRLLQLVDDDFTASFKLRDPDDGGALAYPLIVAKINGQLRLVR